MQPLMRSRSAALALAAALSLLSTGIALAAHPLAGAHYAGKTRQHKPISFDVSATGKRLVHPNFFLRTHCFGGGHSFAQTSAHSTKTASGRIRRGKFALLFSEKARVGHHIKATATFTLKGRFATRKRAKGTASVIVRYSNGAECLSGAVKFSAQAR
jgi:hypothetical protein